ncbi:MAG: hypothetical protein HOD97_07320 [Candidatus Marinimicrobia bacterium]|jgi:5'-nucleotidase|nr:hypothetical protein [Candidatus Neomarinimicrobiota bacterium]MBT3617618.1 hypothetical protein [Candidatus Neomarinimicrobiota bacterium]MBT3829108.1 hypothetical protein [Candidatus Neomarinimicrobiota bacterium]MBT3997710.1 hypothetical protein [Candidatus Neomarinimicrobiota bacterium]MBT4281403.1 hypothetical protein [Candidatus Neomarinimicrobiota bacterium]
MNAIFRSIFLLIVLLTSRLNAEKKSLFILHTNNTNGALENCYCPDHPYGSVEKRVLFVKDFIRKNPNTLLFDAGDFFPVSHRTYLDSLVCVAYSELPYDGILLGDQEFARDPNELNLILPIMNASLIGTNISAPDINGMVAFKRIEKGGFSILVLGIIDPAVFKYYPEPVRARMVVTDPIEALTSAIKTHKNDTNLVVVLSHQGYAKDLELVERVNDIDVVIGSHSQSVIANPFSSSAPIVAQAGKEGYHVGVIVLNMDDKGTLSHSGYAQTMTQKMPDSDRIMDLILEYEEKTGHINRNKLKQNRKSE